MTMTNGEELKSIREMVWSGQAAESMFICESRTKNETVTGIFTIHACSQPVIRAL